MIRLGMSYKRVMAAFWPLGKKRSDHTRMYNLVKVSEQGSLVWEKSYGGAGRSNAYSIIKTGDGNYCITGYVCDAGFSELSGLASKRLSTGIDGFILKITGSGQPVWLKYYGGNALDHLYDMIESSDGSLVCVGETLSTNLDNNYHGECDGWVVKTNSTGTLQWQRAIGGSSQDCFYSSCVRPVGGQERLEMVGVTQSNDGDTSGYHGLFDGYLVSIDCTGNTIYYSKCLGGSKNDQLWDICTAGNQGLILFGTSQSKDGSLSNTLGNGLGWISRVNNQTEMIWQKRIMNDAEGNICRINDGGYVLNGSFYNTNQAYGPLANKNLLLIRFTPEGVMMPFAAGISSDQPSPQTAGTPITINGLSNLDDAEYRFLCYDETGIEIILREWSTDQSVEWTPMDAGVYVIKTQARIPAYPQYVETDSMTFNIN